MMWNSIKVFSKRLFQGMLFLAATWVASCGLAMVLIGGAGLVVKIVGGETGLPWELVDKASERVATVVLWFVASFLVGKLVTEMEN